MTGVDSVSVGLDDMVTAWVDYVVGQMKPRGMGRRRRAGRRTKMIPPSEMWCDAPPVDEPRGQKNEELPGSWVGSEVGSAEHGQPMII